MAARYLGLPSWYGWDGPLGSTSALKSNSGLLPLTPLETEVPRSIEDHESVTNSASHYTQSR